MDASDMKGMQIVLDRDDKTTLGEVVDQLTTVTPLHNDWRPVVSRLYEAAREMWWPAFSLRSRTSDSVRETRRLCHYHNRLDNRGVDGR